MTAWAKQLFILLKLRIGVAMILTAGMAMAITPGHALPMGQTSLFLLAILLSAGAAGGLNHYYDRDIDARMTRTCHRPFVSGALSPSRVWLLFFVALLLLPVVAVWHFINATSALYVFLGAFFYGVVYTIWLKRRTWLNIVIGGLAGSFAVLAGAAAIDPNFISHETGGPLVIAMAVVLFLWTPSHFWSLAIAIRDDYRVAGIPMLPVVAGPPLTAWVIMNNTLLLVAVSLTPFYFGLGWVYLFGALVGGGYFILRTIHLVRTPTTKVAMGSFRASLVQLGFILGAASLDAQWLT